MRSHEVPVILFWARDFLSMSPLAMLSMLEQSNLEVLCDSFFKTKV